MDRNENILTYTTPTEIIQVEPVGSKYSITKSMIKTESVSEYPIIKLDGDDVYVALDFVQKYSDIKYRFYTDPNRVIIDYRWGDYLFTEVSKATQLRFEPNIKSPILLQLPVSEELMYFTDEAPKMALLRLE